MILFHCYHRTAERRGFFESRGASAQHALVFADTREGAKRGAHPFLLGNPDDYVVEPLIDGERVAFVGVISG